ncbi:MAG: hypothetical protein INH37_04975 [Myxococcaceae bacterium]|nr:hypothetical protein [Myxococcaceae bacterium]
MTRSTAGLVMTAVLLAAAQPAGAQARAAAVPPDVEKAIRALRSASPKERVDAANALVQRSSDIVPALLPWSWGCGEGPSREGATPGADCARINEATYHALGVLSAIARREPPTCKPCCPARDALFRLTTAQGGIDWERLPLESDDSALPAPVRSDALESLAKTHFRDAFPLPEWRAPNAVPVARVGPTSVFLALSTTPSQLERACALALFVETSGRRVGALVAREPRTLGLGCQLGRVQAAPAAERPGALALTIDWVAGGGDQDRGQTLLLVEPEAGQLRARCSLSAVGQPELLPRRAALVTLGPKGCIDAAGRPVGLDHAVLRGP